MTKLNKLGLKENTEKYGRTDGQISKSDSINSQSRTTPRHLFIRLFFNGSSHNVSLWQPYCLAIL